LHNEDLNDITLSTNIIRMKTGHVAWVGEMRNTCNILVGNSNGMKSVGRLKCRWKDNIVTCINV
jgi:hypothetical protein